MKKIRVLVVDDSAFMRKVITDMLVTDPRIEVVGTARNGEVCLRKIPELQPDVITLDIEMPVMDGITTLERIMKDNPIPVVMVSTISDADTLKTIQAISKGAIDFVAKPSGSISLDINKVKEEVITKVMTASQAKLNPYKVSEKKLPKNNPSLINNKSIICIGASTGGPRALEKITKSLSENINVPILIVQHMPASFTKSLAKRLNQINQINVKEAENNEEIKSGQVYIAPGDYHMTVKQKRDKLTISLLKTKPVSGHRPSVDVLLKSISSLIGYNKIIVILTGMGRDGANGINQLVKKDKNTFLITESEQSAIINGMPSAARATGHANMTIHIDQIGKSLTNIVK